jgi:hypothetical protein
MTTRKGVLLGVATTAIAVLATVALSATGVASSAPGAGTPSPVGSEAMMGSTSKTMGPMPMRQSHQQMLNQYPQMRQARQRMLSQYPRMGQMHQQMTGDSGG